MNDLQQAIEILNSKQDKIVLVKAKFIQKFPTLDIKILIDLINDENEYEDFSIAISEISRSIAFILVVLGVSKIYTKKISHLATQILDRAQIEYKADSIVDKLDNAELEKLDEIVLRSGSPLNALKDLENALK